jgi:hypothetical protein
MITGNSGDPEMSPGPRMGDIYTPVDPLPDMEDLADDEMLDEDPYLDQSQAEVPGTPSEEPEQAPLDGDVAERTPGHHEADRDFEYDDEDINQVS